MAGGHDAITPHDGGSQFPTGFFPWRGKPVSGVVHRRAVRPRTVPRNAKAKARNLAKRRAATPKGPFGTAQKSVNS
jgi:hypothetical protein